MSDREKLFSITAKDFRFDVFRAGGKGGQGQNKTSSGVRCTHLATGLSRECREERSQLVNKRRAWQRLVESKEFQAWLKMETARHMGREREIQLQVERAMDPSKIRVEVKEDGLWKEVDFESV